MKILILFIITALLIACSTTQNFKQDSQSKTNKFNSIDNDEPIAIKKVPLEYPRFAKKNKIEGTVILKVEVLTDGTVGVVEVLKSLMLGPGGLDEAAIKCVKQWRFSITIENGKPVVC